MAAARRAWAAAAAALRPEDLVFVDESGVATNMARPYGRAPGGQRGRGLGRFLLERAIAHAPQLGIDTLLGFIFGHNDPSLRLFASLGFARWGELPRVAVLDGVERDLIIVGRRVD